MMHISGYPHLDDAEEKAKSDRVNSCASYCSKCIKNSAPSETPGQDCARCSEPGKKSVCGVKKGPEDSKQCHRDHLMACLTDMGVQDCDLCQRRAIRNCDDTIIEQDMPTYCERCPAGTRMNLECGGMHGYTVDTCNDKPPACK